MKKLFLFALCLTLTHLSWAKTYDIKKLGADATGKKACTELINKTIDKAAREGGGTIYFPAGTYLTATIEMKCLDLAKMYDLPVVDFLPDFMAKA